MSNKITQLTQLVKKIRAQDAWTAKQNHHTLTPYMLEEAAELVDAIEQRRGSDALKSELADVLYQVVLHSEVASQQGSFEFDDVVQTLMDKLNARQSGGHSSEKAFPTHHYHNALLQSRKLSQQAAKLGFDWPEVEGVIEKVLEEVDEVKQEALCTPINLEATKEEVGDLFFSVVNLARHLEVDPEQALRVANDKFIRRFNFVCQQAIKLKGNVSDCTIEELESFWQMAKQNEMK